MAPNIYDKVCMYYSLPILAVMTAYSLYWFIYVIVKSKFRWVQFMLFLCVVQNADTFWIEVLNVTTVTPFH